MEPPLPPCLLIFELLLVLCEQPPKFELLLVLFEQLAKFEQLLVLFEQLPKFELLRVSYELLQSLDADLEFLKCCSLKYLFSSE